ncbi:hypothetical protein BJF78_06640 [Pseudonocardia sp. CNS-139]|nr:hypothetical protein BJF78_06640 [Pseudonocardia sp. CNS-139]
MGDHELWELARTGDREAFTALYHRHADAVWSHAHRLTGSGSAAEDVLAATFLTAWRRRGSVRFVAESARPWLLAVAGNEARTEWRRTARHRRLFQRLGWLGAAPVVDDHAEAVVASLDDRRRVDAALGGVRRISDRDSRAQAAPGDTAGSPEYARYEDDPAAPPGTTCITALIDQDPPDTP